MESEGYRDHSVIGEGGLQKLRFDDHIPVDKFIDNFQSIYRHRSHLFTDIYEVLKVGEGEGESHPKVLHATRIYSWNEAIVDILAVG